MTSSYHRPAWWSNRQHQRGERPLAPGTVPEDYDGRPTQPWMLLVTEIDAAAALLDHADAILREIRFSNEHLEPLLTVWSIGAEKLLKLTIGAIHTDEHAD